MEQSIGAYRDRMLAKNAQEVQARELAPDTPARSRALLYPATQPAASSGAGIPASGATTPSGSMPPVATTQPMAAPIESLLIGPSKNTAPPSPLEVLAQIPDPVDAARVLDERLENLRREEEHRKDPRVVRNYQKVISEAKRYLDLIRRPKVVRMSLSEAVQRTLQNNYVIRAEAYNPAISTTQIVEAEAAFDAEFFLDGQTSRRDTPNPPFEFPPFYREQTTYSGGFRKLLPSGMQLTTELRQQYNWTDFDQKTLDFNPSYGTAWINTLRQPLLRGFGLNVNRAQIVLRSIERDIAGEVFVQRVRDTLFQVETAYWTLVRTRREVAILAETLAQNGITYQNLLQRGEHDATIVEISNAEASFRLRETEYLEAIRAAKQAEDEFKNLLDDPAFKLSEEIEIIPTEVPLIAPLAIDLFGEVRTAVEQRQEILAARKRIEAARVNTSVAKNQTLPQLDLTFSYQVDGLRRSADASFDEASSGRFSSITVGVQFSVPIGNRARLAAHDRARMQEAQSVVELQRICDEVALQVNTAVRTLLVRWSQVPPQLLSVVAAVRNLRALQARTQRIDPPYLQTELNGVQQVASARTALLRVIIDYNTQIAELERSKGTLLQYNNVQVSNPARR